MLPGRLISVTLLRCVAEKKKTRCPIGIEGSLLRGQLLRLRLARSLAKKNAPSGLISVERTLLHRQLLRLWFAGSLTKKKTPSGLIGIEGNLSAGGLDRGRATAAAFFSIVRRLGGNHRPAFPGCKAEHGH